MITSTLEKDRGEKRDEERDCFFEIDMNIDRSIVEYLLKKVVL